MKNALAVVAAGLFSSFAAPALAGAGHDTMNHDPGTIMKVADMGAMSEGLVKKIDKSRSRITIKHGPLANLNMPPMTMVFHVKEAAMLDAVKPGDKVKFTAEDVGGALTVTGIETAK